MRDDITDPEVIADLQLRASSERDTSRTRGPMRPFGRGPDVEEWPCRGGCGAMVGVTEDVIDIMVMFSNELAKRGEKPLDPTKTVFCQKCRDEGRRFASENRWKEIDKVREWIRALKATPPPSALDERDLLKKLRAAGHPDLKGLETAIRERREGKAKKSGRDA